MTWSTASARCVSLLQHVAEHCNTLQHATHCNTLQNIATHFICVPIMINFFSIQKQSSICVVGSVCSSCLRVTWRAVTTRCVRGCLCESKLCLCVFMSVSVSVSVCACVCVCLCKCACVHACMRVCACVRVCVCTCVRVCVRVYVLVCVRAYVRACVCALRVFVRVRIKQLAFQSLNSTNTYWRIRARVLTACGTIFVCICTYTCTCIYTYTWTYMNGTIYVCIYTYIFTCTYTYTYTYIKVCIYITHLRCMMCNTFAKYIIVWITFAVQCK